MRGSYRFMDDSWPAHQKVMGMIVELIKNPQNWASVGFLGLFWIMMMEAKKDFDEIKKHTRVTGEKLKEHGEVMSNINTKVIFLREELIKEIQSILFHIGKIERNMEKIDQSIGLKVEKIEASTTFISNLKNDLDHLYGHITKIDEKTDGLTVSIAMNKRAIDMLGKVVTSHNESIKEIKKK